MALNATDLAKEIKDAIEENVSKLDNKYAFNTEDNPFGNAFIEAIAEAVVAHITTSAEVNITIPSYSAPPGGGSVTGSAKGKIT